MPDNRVFIVSGCRTPIGDLGGWLYGTHVTDLGGTVIKDSLVRGNVQPRRVSEVIMGQVFTSGQGPNPAHQASLKAGIPKRVPAYTVNMLEGSGLKAIYLGYQSIKLGDANIVVAGGQENMSQATHSALMRNKLGAGSHVMMDNIASEAFFDPNLIMMQADAAESLAQIYNVNREEQDLYANLCQLKTSAALIHGYFIDEIVPVRVKFSDLIYSFKEDEFPKPSTCLDSLRQELPFYYGNHIRTLTNGNSTGLNDGAAAVVLCNAEELRRLRVEPLCSITAFAEHGLKPIESGLGVVGAVKKVLSKAHWRPSTVDVYEIHETFAAEAIIAAKLLRIPEWKLNVNGGAIALGHPMGCSGARILVTLLYNMRHMNKRRGIAALSIGGGMGIAIAVERNAYQNPHYRY